MNDKIKNAMKAAYRVERCKTRSGKKKAIKAWADAARKMLGAS